MRLWLYVVRRVILLFPVLVGVMTILWAVQAQLPVSERLAAAFGTPTPHDPFIYQPTQPCLPPRTGECPNPLYGYYTAKLGLNQPVPIQWGYYLYGLFTLHWGIVGNGSAAAGDVADIGGIPVASVVAAVGPYSLELGLLAGAMLVFIGIPLGRVAAARRNQAADLGVRGLSLALRALPTYFLGTLLLVGMYIWVGSLSHWSTFSPWCPGGEASFNEFVGSWPSPTCFGGGYPSWIVHGVYTVPTGFPTIDALLNGSPALALDSVLRLILPAATIAFTTMALLVRFVRGSTLEVLNLDYIRAARANGIPEREVLRRHAGRNATNLTLTVLGLTFSTFLGWFPAVELVFGLNGIGSTLAYAAMIPYDFGLMFGITFVLSILVIVTSLVVDVLYAWFDPRVRLG
jgi:dipeptide transport system permease protein